MSQSHYHLHSVLPHSVMLTTAGVPLDSCGKIFWDFAGFFLGGKKKVSASKILQRRNKSIFREKAAKYDKTSF